MKKINIFLLLFILANFAQAKVIEHGGNRNLKKLKKIEHNSYIGISEACEDLQQAIDSAISHAQTQIVQNLGIEVDINIRIADEIQSNNNRVEQKITISKKMNYSGVYNISLKANEVYWEKHRVKKDEFYLAYVKIHFSKSAYIKDINERFESMSDEIGEELAAPLEKNIERLLLLKRNISEFERSNYNHKVLADNNILTDYQRNLAEFESLWADLCSNIHISQINSDERFPKEIFVYFSYKGVDLRGLTVYVNTNETRRYKTNSDGFINIKPEYSRFVEQNYLISVAPISDDYKQLPQLNINQKSPLYNRNLRFLVVIESEFYEQGLIDDISFAFQERGFSYKIIDAKTDYIANDYDFALYIKINTVYKNDISNVSQFFYDTRFLVELQKPATREVIRTWEYPNPQYSLLRSVGNSRLSARKNAIALRGVNNRKALWSDLLREIEQAAKQKNFSM
ncbi:MAG: hypothetical protein PHF36_01655 [Candidatus Cloacimonetes bacterium]|mgnify:CR=1 FL=1|jgi:hypothetical protein|nr:hypothetical protein [Candidatus Cloacimonadota bacterium]